MQIASIPNGAPRRGISDYHVVPHGNVWMLTRESSPFRQMATTQVEAIGYGIGLARTEAVSLIIHGADGRFREVYDYSRVG